MVSIIIPCFNKAKYLSVTLESILAQTFHEWECIIVNDGSPDNTEEIALKYIENDHRFKYFKQENTGVSVARNNGIRQAKYNYILPLDSDDTIEPTFLSKTIQILITKPEIDIVYCDKRYFGAKTGINVLPEFSINTVLVKNTVLIASLHKKKVWEETGGYSESFIYGAEDWDYWLSAYEKGFKFFKINEALYNYRELHDSRDKLYKGNIDKRTITHNLIVKRHIDLYQENLGSFVDVYNEVIRYKKALYKIHNSPWFKWQFWILKKLKAIY